MAALFSHNQHTATMKKFGRIEKEVVMRLPEVARWVK